MLMALVAAPVVAQQPQKRAPFAVAEVRADGLLVPIAMWDGTRWHELAMANVDSMRRAAGIASLAPQSRWYYVPFSGTRAPLILGEAAKDDSGFTTNLVVPQDSARNHSRMVGVATSDSVPLRLFTRAASREAALARAAMRRLLDSASKTLSESERKEVQRLPAPSAADTLTLGASVARLSGDGTLMYADARLPISACKDGDSGIFAGYSGFAILRGERVQLQLGDRVSLQNTPVIGDCEKGLPSEEPHALFEVAGRTFVLATHYYYEDSAPFIWEWRDPRLALVFPPDP
jgi:hypothetical protein